MRVLYIIIGLFFSLVAHSNNLPVGFFDWPVKHEIRLSGTFGELRTNHFHGGLDIKSKNGGSGDQLYSAADGYISRISVQPHGYGNALYITHPNGYTTVYGHMSSFSKEVEAYVKKIQYQQERFKQDIHLSPEVFPLSKGEMIGVMGNSGSSEGAHLHFEIRETATNKLINPLLFGLEIEDVIAPRIYEMKLYEFDEENKATASKSVTVIKTGNTYRIKGDTLKTTGAFWGLALKAYDKHNYTHNKNGVYAMEMHLDGVQTFSFAMDAIPVSDSRYLNAHLDYRERVGHRAYFNRFFKLPGNKLDIYKGSEGDGLVTNNARFKQVLLKVLDANGNLSTLEFVVEEVQKRTKSSDPLYNYHLYHNYPNLIVEDDFEVFFPENALYLDELVYVDMMEDNSKGYYSDVLKLHTPLTPLHKPINIALRIKDRDSISSEILNKLYIGHCDAQGHIRRVGGELEGDFMKASVWGLGNYSIFVDQQKPTIRPIIFSYNAKRLRRFRFVIDDDVSATRSAGELKYRAEIDGNWVLFTYDQKYKTITYYFDETIKPGKHNLRLEVEDLSGNTTVFEKAFIK